MRHILSVCPWKECKYIMCIFVTPGNLRVGSMSTSGCIFKWYQGVHALIFISFQVNLPPQNQDGKEKDVADQLCQQIPEPEHHQTTAESIQDIEDEEK